MDSRRADWMPHSFSRTPAWRMSRAAYRLAEGRPHDPRVDDDGVELAVRLLGPKDAADVPAAVRAAFAVWTRDGVPRWLLEANLLTTRTTAEVGVACALAEPVVRAYHELFFDVRPRLKATDWVFARAVGSTPLNDFAGPQPAGVLKYLGFIGGPLVLDVVVAATLDRPLPILVCESFVTDPVLEERALRLRAKLAVAALTARSPFQLAAVARLRDALLGLEADAGRSTGNEGRLGVLADLLSAMDRPAGPRPKTSPSTVVPLRRRSRPTPSPRPTNTATEDTRATTTQK